MPISAKKLIIELQNAGYVIKSQQGSHIKLHNPETKKTIIIPFHNGDVKKGLEMAIRKEAGLK